MIHETSGLPEFASQRQLATLFDTTREQLEAQNLSFYRVRGEIVAELFPGEAATLGIGNSLTVLLQRPDAEEGVANQTIQFSIDLPEDSNLEAKSLVIEQAPGDSDAGSAYTSGWEELPVNQSYSGGNAAGQSATDTSLTNANFGRKQATVGESAALQKIMNGFDDLRQRRDEYAQNLLHGLLNHVEALWSARESRRDAAVVEYENWLLGHDELGDLWHSPSTAPSPVEQRPVYSVGQALLGRSFNDWHWADVRYAPNIPGQRFTSEGIYDPTLATITVTFRHRSREDFTSGMRIVLSFSPDRLVQEEHLLQYGRDEEEPRLLRTRSSKTGGFALTTPEIEDLHMLITHAMSDELDRELYPDE